jgi:hypothetical protein
MKIKPNQPRLAILLALAVAFAPALGNSETYAGVNAKIQSKVKTPAAPALPPPAFPFPCAPAFVAGAAPCSPHWFYLENGATVTADQPLVITVTGTFSGSQGSFPYSQPDTNAENAISEPTVPVGISGSGLTLQPRNTTPYGDNQMWYAIETGLDGSNPSFLVSSLPPLINPVMSASSDGSPLDASPATSLALGYVGNPNLTSPSESISFINGESNPATTPNTWADVTISGSISFLPGQIIDISGDTNDEYNGIHAVQTIDTPDNLFSVILPRQNSLSGGTGGTATAMAAVYLLQQSPNYLDPTYSTNFQQWNFDATDRTICNNLGACLYSVDSAPQPGSIVSAGPKPSTVTANYQWYFYPDRTLSLILQQKPVAFPRFTGAAHKAETYIAQKLANLGLPPDTVPPGPGCTYNGNTYYGLRCEYSNLAAPLSTYTSALFNLKRPGNVSAKTFKAVKNELILESTNAIAVQNLYVQFDFVYSTVLFGSEDLVNQDLADLAVDITDQTHTKKAFWHTLEEGLLYATLNLIGSIAGIPDVTGVGTAILKGASIGLAFGANAMETAVNSEMVPSGSTDPLANQFAGTAADLYSYLFDDFTVLGQLLDAQEQAILQDWGKLQLIGLLAQQRPSLDNGMAGLYWDPASTSVLVKKFTDAYQISILQQLLPQYFDLYEAVDWVGGSYTINGDADKFANQLNNGTISYAGLSTGISTPGQSQPPAPVLLNQFSTPSDVQGSSNGMWNVGWLFISTGADKGSQFQNSYLTPQLAQDLQNANPYLLYNGLGAWSGFSASNPNILSNVACNASFTTITNFTPKALKVILDSDESFGGGYGATYGAGGSNSNISDFSSASGSGSGVSGKVDRTLPPFGVLQFAVWGSSQSVTVSIYDFSTSLTQDVASFVINLTGSSKDSCGQTSVTGKTTNSGYVLTNDYETGAPQPVASRTVLIGIGD